MTRHALVRTLALGGALGLSACAQRGHLVMRKAGPRPTPVAVSEPVMQPQALTPTAEPAPQAITVAPGDSLWRLSRQTLGAGARYPELAAANRVSEPWIIRPGQVLSLPSGAAPALSRAAKAPARPAKDDPAKLGWQRRENRAYAVGEKLTFAVQYGSVTAGYATLHITELAEVSGRPCLHVVAEATTHPFFEKFFKVRDRIESFIDIDYGFTWRYEKHLREGGYSADAFYLFDQRIGKMSEPAKGKIADMPIGTQDVMSCFYYARTVPQTVGSEFTVPVSADDMKSYQLRVKVLRKERASTLAGDFDCVVVQPFLTFQGVFQQKGEVLLWITDDERRIPVKIRSKIAIVAININLQDAEWVEPSI